jgi:hypothetical protein
MRRLSKSDRWGCAHRFRPTYPDFLHGAPPTSTCAAFIKESRMMFRNASKVDRKSGVRLGERGAPVPFRRVHPARMPEDPLAIWILDRRFDYSAADWGPSSPHTC